MSCAAFDLRDDAERTVDAILMKAKTPISPAKIGIFDSANLAMPLLGGNARRRIDRVVIDHPFDDAVRGYALAVV